MKFEPRIRGQVDTGARSTSRINATRSRDTRRVLLINSSIAASRFLGEAIQKQCERQVEALSTLAQVRSHLDRTQEEFLAAVVGLELSDASGVEIVEFALGKGLPTIVLTGSWREETRRTFCRYSLFDYFVKGKLEIDGVCRALNRIPLNSSTKVLVVDDSAAARELQSSLLRAHRFQVFLAADGAEALQVLAEHPDTTLVITDYEMPTMDGITLAMRIRESHGADEIAIVGVSAQGASTTAVRFLKHGASDFLAKPFEKEEFYCRIYNCINTIENARAIRKAAFTDSLTGLANRLAFFTQAPAKFAESQVRGESMAMAMVDIDFFKKVNDSYGHAAGDEVLRCVATLMAEYLGKAGLVARFGGEEFCVFCPGLDRDETWEIFDKLRVAVAATPVFHDGQTIRVTLSIGVTLAPRDSLDETINHADQLLYEAKNSGRNRVVISPRALGSGVNLIMDQLIPD